VEKRIAALAGEEWEGQMGHEHLRADWAWFRESIRRGPKKMFIAARLERELFPRIIRGLGFPPPSERRGHSREVYQRSERKSGKRAEPVRGGAPLQPRDRIYSLRGR